ncbi:hypothetical protein D9M71_280070 [compost metagenome]
MFRVIDQQIDFLPGQCQLHDLTEDVLHLGPGHIQRLGDLPQHAGRIGSAARRHHDTLYRLFVGTGNQRLAQQRLAAAIGAGHHQQQLAVASQMVQLPQYRLALGRKKLEARHPRGKGVVVQLVMAEKGLIGVQTIHRTLLPQSWATMAR